MAAYSNDSAVGRQDGGGGGHGDNVAYYDRFAGVYELFFRDLRSNMEEEGAWLSDLLTRCGAVHVLDASCGTGRQAIPLAQRGFKVVAADPSNAMLERARLGAGEHHVQLPTHRLRFDDLPHRFAGSFHAVIAMGNGLCNLETRLEVARALEALRRCLTPGGVCVLGIKDFDAVCRNAEPFHGHTVLDRDGTRRILFEVWDVRESQLVSTAYLLEGPCPGKDGTWATFTAVTREYMLRKSELLKLGMGAGFTSIESLKHPSEAAYLLKT